MCDKLFIMCICVIIYDSRNASGRICPDGGFPGQNASLWPAPGVPGHERGEQPQQGFRSLRGVLRPNQNLHRTLQLIIHTECRLNRQL